MTIQQPRPRAAEEEPGHNVEPRTVKPAYNNLRSANPGGSIQLILRQNLSLVLNLAGLKAISLPPSLLRPLPLTPLPPPHPTPPSLSPLPSPSESRPSYPLCRECLAIFQQSISSYAVLPPLILVVIIQPYPISVEFTVSF